MSIYNYLDYVKYIKKEAISNSKQRGTKAKLADASGCQRSYFSQVLSGKAHLSHEQAYLLCSHWGFSDQETDYFLNLVSYAKAGSKKLKSYFHARIKNAQVDQNNIVNRIKEEKVIPEESASLLYSSWQNMAVLILISIEKYQDLESIANRLQISFEITEQTLKLLLQLGLVYRSGNKWLPCKHTIHLPKSSPYNSLNHSHWRTKAISDSHLTNKNSIHYTSVCTLSLRDSQELSRHCFELIDKSREIISPSNEEELFCLNLDWFQV